MIPVTPAKTLYGAPEGQDARILAELAREYMREDRVLVHVARDDVRLSELQELLSFFIPEAEQVIFPAWDCLPYDRISPHADIVGKRVRALTRLLGWQKDQRRYPRILMTTVNALLQRVTPKASLETSVFSIRTGEKFNLSDLQTYLAHNGYSRSETVREAGEFALRGGIMDIFPTGHEYPVRLDLFGDEVESIKSFDPMTQLTTDKQDHFSLIPVSEFFLDPDSIARFRSGYREAFGVVTTHDPLYTAVSEGRKYNGMDHWLPLFFGRLETIFDYLPKASVTMDHLAGQAMAERMLQINDFYSARLTLQSSQKQKKSKDVSLSGAVYHPIPPDRLYVSADELPPLIDLSPFAPPEENDALNVARRSRDFSNIRAQSGGDVFAELKSYLAHVTDRPVLIAGYSEGSIARLSGMMTHAGISSPKPCAEYTALKKLKPGDVGMAILPLEHGFIAPDLLVLTEQDILGDRLTRQAAKLKKADNFLTEISALSPGDLVVHLDHGVGRFEGLETLKAAGTLHDCLKIIYDGGDKLFVPVENIDVLSRFGSDEGNTPLDRLGGAGWQARKSKVKKDLLKIAEQLLAISAQRLLRRGQKLSVDHDSYNRFTAKFPYAETEDQLRAISDVIKDIAGEMPMDRLVCGDVGFGKTEVALRAAYVSAMSGVQVAVVVPTTLLARQHFANFTQRFEGTGIRIGQLSRLASAKDVKLTKDGLADGSTQIVVGTHAIFAKDITFNNLGLLIVDEEQRFGVKQKERLKEIKEDVHVLTLTATPIPRTLQMSLSGVKEMSLITTPPVDRLAIRTFILPFDPMVIREALLREHYRGGQSFYVCPRIGDMAEVEEKLRELVPEVKIISAHGQMTPTELEDRMTAFYDGQYDVLLATNIIESGIDIPRANTMIIHRSDLFGLSQLYQIRGRIGRSKVRAYAYLTYQPDIKLTTTAQKRLEVIETLDTLGSGFQLASHDMDIRGAGNLLGEEQSGHIREVGVELYQQMLEDAVTAARAGVKTVMDMADHNWSPQINMGTSVLIPETYISDLTVRMSLYRRLAGLETREDIDGFAAELIDRFGALPPEVDNLLDIVTIKQYARRAGIDKVEAGPKGALIGFYKDAPPNIPKLMGWVADQRGAVKIRPDQKISILRGWEDTSARVKGIQSILYQLAEIAG
ncbi:MAG: transcription-repair coupling factor [Alphaproteobacteria bacterium]|nr:transcription-repair coupling factor [Alphaproteobacteria bacterium]